MLVKIMFAIKKINEKEIFRDILRVFQQKSGGFFVLWSSQFYIVIFKNKPLKLTLLCQSLQTISIDQNYYTKNKY